MTREEIIRNLKYTMEKHKNDTVNTFDTNIFVMCKDILEYLEQEPCEDTISRQAVLDLIADYDLSMGQVVRGIHALPSVKPQESCDVPDTNDGKMSENPVDSKDVIWYNRCNYSKIVVEPQESEE